MPRTRTKLKDLLPTKEDHSSRLDDNPQQPEPIKEPQPQPEPIEAPPKDEPEAERPQPGRPKEPDSRSSKLERGEFKQMKAILSADLHKRVKLAAVTEELEISAIIEEALEEWLARHI